MVSCAPLGCCDLVYATVCVVANRPSDSRTPSLLPAFGRAVPFARTEDRNQEWLITMSGTIEKVLFVGLGAMGEPMAALLAPGWDLRVNDVSAERTSEVASTIGATAVANVGEAASDVDAVVLMLPNSRIVEDLLRGTLFASLRPGTLIIDMSSSRPESTQILASEADALGLSYVDAPVSGGRARALTGELAIMVGGEGDAKRRARPILETLGGSVVDTGASGTGHAMKALNNLLSATGLLAACEVLVAGSRFGLDPQVMLDVLNTSTGRNHATEVKMAKFVLSRSFDAGFALDLMVKDLRTAAELIDGAFPEPSVTAATVTAWTNAQTFLNDPRADHTAIARWVESHDHVEAAI
ncbi:NAD(P)-dependent oxidoreductase [Microbacterium oxydans]|uniref:NAD(P)-dependent oxidoreductase n=1 Tax=Microbacterium oxydans TaxID=82380 RepID=UPI0025B6F6F9|nr:NAD(P)-dependent oxidoreductase [Microbacterium oxydans]